MPQAASCNSALLTTCTHDTGFLLGTRQTLLETFDGGKTWTNRCVGNGPARQVCASHTSTAGAWAGKRPGNAGAAMPARSGNAHEHGVGTCS